MLETTKKTGKLGDSRRQISPESVCDVWVGGKLQDDVIQAAVRILGQGSPANSPN